MVIATAGMIDDRFVANATAQLQARPLVSSRDGMIMSDRMIISATA